MHLGVSRVSQEESNNPTSSDLEPVAGKGPDHPALSSLLTTNATLVVWLLFIGFGGALLSLYYRGLHFFPDLDWHQSLTFLVAFSILGGGFVVVYSLLLYVPGVMWSEFLIFDTEFQDILCYHGPHGWEPCYWSIGRLVAIPFAVFTLYVHVVVMLLGTLGGWISAGLAALLGLPALLTYSWSRFGRELTHRSRERAKVHYLREPHQVPRKALLTKYVLAFGLSSSLNLVSVLLIHALIVDKPDPEQWLLMTICTVVVVASNLLVAVQFQERPSRAVLAGVLAALTLLVSGEVLSNEGLSTRIMKKFGFGSEEVTLIVNKEGRALLEGYKLAPEPAGEYGVLPGVLIFSRLGDEYLIGVQERRIVLPKTVVVSWARSGPALSTIPTLAPSSMPPSRSGT